MVRAIYRQLVWKAESCKRFQSSLLADVTVKVENGSEERWLGLSY